MKSLSLFGCLLLLLTSCQPKNPYDAKANLSPQEQDKVVTGIIRYVGKKPDKANDSSKFSTQFNDYYLEQASKHTLALYYQDANGTQYFLMTRKAPSIHEKYVATGGRFRLDTNDSLIEYEEVFRTWKMHPDTLARRSFILFDSMVKGKSLDEYLTKNSKGVEYIEFPDDFVYYDKAQRKWKSNQYGSVEELVGVED